jgi:hypothetical protein
VYTPGASAVFGHQNRSVVLLLYTKGLVAVAVVPDTDATPVRVHLSVPSAKQSTVPITRSRLIVAPKAKFVPLSVTDRLVVTPYVTDTGLTLVSVGCGSVTVKPPAKLASSPPEAVVFVTRTS